MPKLIGITAISAIIILSIGILPPPQNENNVTFTNVQGFETEEEALSFELDNLQEIEFSIIESEIVFTESDQSLVEQFLDENDLPSSSEKFGIEVQTVLFDSDLTQYPSSSILSIPALELTDSEGRLLDLGSIQTSFLGIVSDSNRGSETTFNMEGTVKFYLDDTLITTKKLYGSEQGDSKTFELSILDSLPPTSFDRPQAFTFTLSDEGQGWIDGSEHIYRIIITDIDAKISSNKDLEKYTFNGEKIAYELKVTLDESKKVILGEDSYAVSIFKNDSTIQVCANSHFYKFKNPGTFNTGIGGTSATTYSVNPTVEIRDADGIPIVTKVTATKPVPNILDEDMPCGSKHCYGTRDLRQCSSALSGIPRNADIIIDVKRDGETKSYEVHTPKSQFNYYLDTQVSEVKSFNCKSFPYGKCQGKYQIVTPIFEVFTSNFGYNSDDTIWDSSVVRTP